jgi:hypothetical protein
VRRNIIVLIESIMFAMFWIFGVEINQNGVVNFQDAIMYFKILGFTIIFFICITVLYIFLEKMEEKSENKLSEESSKINLKKYIIIAIIFLICWTPVFFAVFPGYFCYDAYYQYYQVATNNFTTQHPILHTILLGGIVHSIYLLTGSYNLGIAIYTILQAILASTIFSYTIFFMEKYNVSKKLRMIGILYYCFFPVIHMFVLNSSKDTLYTLMMILYMLSLIDIFNNKEKYFKRKRNILKYALIVILLCFFRNNGIYVIIGITLMSIFLIKSEKIILINIFLISLYIYIWGIVTQLPNVNISSPAEMLSVPMQQMAYVYNYSDDITDEEKSKIEYMFMHGEEALKLYVPELSDPIKKYFRSADLFQNFNFYIKLGIKHKSEYINAFLLNTIGYWYPNQLVDGYIKANIEGFEERKTCYFAAITDNPGTRKSLFPKLEKIYFEISSEGTVENIPIISLLFSIGANIWLIFIILFYGIYKKKHVVVLYLSVIIITWFMMLLGPIVQVRYILIIFFLLPLNIAMLLNNKCFYGLENENI